MRELLAAPRHVLLRLLDLQLGGLVDLLARLVVAAHEPRQHERLRPGAALRQAALHEEHVEPLLHATQATQAVRVASPATISPSTDVSASIASSRACARPAASSARLRAPSMPWLRT